MTEQSIPRTVDPTLARGYFDAKTLLTAGREDVLEYMAEQVRDWHDLYGVSGSDQYHDLIEQYDAYRERHGLRELAHLGSDRLRAWWSLHGVWYIATIYPWADGLTWCAGRDIIRYEGGREFLDSISHLHPGIRPARGVIGFNLAMYILGRITRMYQCNALPLPGRMPTAKEADDARDAEARAWLDDVRTRGLDPGKESLARWLDRNPQQKWLRLWQQGGSDAGIDYAYRTHDWTGAEVLDAIAANPLPRPNPPSPCKTVTVNSHAAPHEAQQITPWLPIERQRALPIEIALPSPTLEATQGWLSPSGDLYPSRTEGHNELQTLLERTFGIADLERAGWIHLQPTRRFKTSERWIVTGAREPTQSQIDAIFDWCARHDDEYPGFLKGDSQG